MVKTFWPFKTLFHTYTHTLSCIPGEFQVFSRVLNPFGYQMDPNIEDTGQERFIRSHSSARFSFELSGNSN